MSNGHQVAGRRNKSASEHLCKLAQNRAHVRRHSKGVQVRFRRLFVFAARRRRSRIFHPIVELALSILCWQSITVAQTQVHHHHGSEGIPPEVIEKLGTVQMPISCAASTSTTFERGVAMLHSFWYEEARKEFTSVATTDPSCAMAQWGLAMTEWRPFWDGMPDSWLLRGGLEIRPSIPSAWSYGRIHQ
jgi:hypothetical protein